MNPISTMAKPRLRGIIHAAVTPVVLAAGTVLICLAPTAQTKVVASVYSACGVLLFAMSAVYHRGTWSPRVRTILRSIDHSNVYLLIAGTYTPIVALGMSGTVRVVLLTLVWAGALAGIVTTCFWRSAPRWLATGLYVLLGWLAVPGMLVLLHDGGVAVFVLTAAGGLIYTVGAVVYALRRPNPSPTWFGFHEIFHVCTVAAWVAQYIAVSILSYTAH